MIATMTGSVQQQLYAAGGQLELVRHSAQGRVRGRHQRRTDARGTTKLASEWLAPSGRATKLESVTLTRDVPDQQTTMA